MEKRNKNKFFLFFLSSISGKIGIEGVASSYNFTNEENENDKVLIEINDYNKSLLNKYKLRFASEKFTFEEISEIQNEFKTFLPKNKTFALAETSYEAKEMVNSLNLRFAAVLDEVTEKLNKKFKTKMEKRNIELNIETAERWYKEGNLEMKQLALEAFPELEKNKLPKSWCELKEISGCYVDNESRVSYVRNGDALGFNRNIFATKEQAEASIALAQLSQLREVYRNGWVPDWNDQEQIKHCFESSLFICFQDGETYDLFYNNFKDLIKKAKPLMQ